MKNFNEEIKKLVPLESALIDLIAKTGNEVLMDTFVKWQEQREVCNTMYLEFVDNIRKKAGV